MSWFSRPKRKPVVGLYGKHPTAADFVRVEAAGQALKAFDRWLSEALVDAARLVGDWESRYQDADITHFLFCSEGTTKEPGCLVGSFAASCDRSGRSYPLIVFAELPLELALVAYPAVPLHGFLEESSEVLAQRAELDHERLGQAVRALALPDEPSVKAALARRDDVLRGTDSEKALEELFGAGFGAQAQTAALDQLKSIARATRDSSSIGRFGIRCPLGANTREHAAFWLSLLERNLGLPLVPQVLWTRQNALLYLHSLSSKALAALWSDWTDEALLDLRGSGEPGSGAGSSDARAPSMPAEDGRPAGKTLAELLE